MVLKGTSIKERGAAIRLIGNISPIQNHHSDRFRIGLSRKDVLRLNFQVQLIEVERFWKQMPLLNRWIFVNSVNKIFSNRDEKLPSRIERKGTIAAKGKINPLEPIIDIQVRTGPIQNERLRAEQVGCLEV